jgi:hypothetical protein
MRVCLCVGRAQCGHLYCYECIKRVCETAAVCSVCQRKVDLGHVIAGTDSTGDDHDNQGTGRGSSGSSTSSSAAANIPRHRHRHRQ